MDDDLQQLLINLKLKKILEILPDTLERAEEEGSSYTELLSRLLREEYQEREMRYLGHRIRRAQLTEPWTLESFPWDRQPGVKRAVIEELALLSFIERASNIVFIGETGTGKTGLSVGLLRKALERGKRGQFMKAQDLFDDMYASLADRSSRKLLNRLDKLDFLVLDEMGYLNLRPEQSNIFFKLMEERYGRKPTIITTNLRYEDWYGFLGQKEMVGALLDRLRHRCTTIEINGPSLRGPE